MPINKQVDKKAVVHIYNGVLLGYKKKNKILLFATAQMGLEGIRQSEMVRERQAPYDLTYVWNLKNNTNEQTKQKHTPRTGRWLPEGRGRLGDWGKEKGSTNTGWELQKGPGV